MFYSIYHPRNKKHYKTFNSILNEFKTTLNAPKYNIINKGDNVEIEMALAGLSKEDIEIKIEKNILIIKSEKESKDNSYLRKEFDFSHFEKRFEIPTTLDSNTLSATMKDGILKISITKKNKEEDSIKKIEIL